MAKLNLYELYKELYHKENERKAEIVNSLNIPIAVTTAISTGIFYFITNFDYQVEGFLNFIFVGLSSITTICVLLSIYNLIRAFSDFTKGYEYTGIPYVQQLHNWYQELKEYYKEHGDKKKTDEADEHLQQHLVDGFVEHIDHNMYVNDRKTKFVFQSKRWLVISLVSILITAIPFGYNFFNKADKIQKIVVLSDDTLKTEEAGVNKVDSLINLINKLKLQYEQQKDSTTSATPKAESDKGGSGTTETSN